MLSRALAVLAICAIGAKAGDSLHMVNCGEGNNGSSDSDSVIVFCDNDSNCNFNPAPQNFCTVSDGGVLTTWERQGSCTFDTQVTVDWSIEQNARSQPNYSEVGNADNGSQQFTCYKDDGHQMYTDSFGQSCDSIYYCL